MVIFNSYVKLPEGRFTNFSESAICQKMGARWVSQWIGTLLELLGATVFAAAFTQKFLQGIQSCTVHTLYDIYNITYIYNMYWVVVCNMNVISHNLWESYTPI